MEKTDRLYRNIKDWVLVDELGMDIHFVKENVIVGPQSRSADKFLHGIKVLMAKNYVDNLGEEVRKGMLEKARQGHWPSFAPIGYVNSPVTRRIEPDPERAPIITKLFEWYATGNVSLKAITKKAAAAGLTNRGNGKPLVRSKIHQLLQNPIYSGDFMWLRCGYAFTAELKKGLYVYYHCTGAKGPCGNSYIREEDLALLLGDLVKRVRIPTELADAVAKVLRESQSDKESFVRATTMRLQQQQLTIRAKLDRAYDDRLSGRIPDDLWTSKSAELEEELRRIRAEMAQHERASHDYERTGLQILELAQTAYSLYVTQSPLEQARLLKTLLSNCTFDRGTLCPTYRKPFDLFAQGSETGDWLAALDDFRNCKPGPAARERR